MNHQCSSSMFGGTSQSELCAPLAQLKKEHVSLREKMDAFAAMSAAIRLEPADGHRGKLPELAKAVEKFTSELEPHSEREEGCLFPLMAKYIGRETGPIAVMEYEHDQAKENLKLFSKAIEKLDLGADIDLERVQMAVTYALKVHAILTDHFTKEEHVLFPMAQTMLSFEEKEQLSQAFRFRA